MKPTDWISVKDRLPEIKGSYSEDVFVWGCTMATIGVYSASEGWMSYDLRIDNDKITHWMPIAPPEAGKQYVLQINLNK